MNLRFPQCEERPTERHFVQLPDQKGRIFNSLHQRDSASNNSSISARSSIHTWFVNVQNISNKTNPPLKAAIFSCYKRERGLGQSLHHKSLPDPLFVDDECRVMEEESNLAKWLAREAHLSHKHEEM